MKQSLIIVVILCLLLGASFTVMYGNQKVAGNKPAVCCKKTGGKVQQNKIVTPVSYAPVMNIF